jgi:alpha-beta hydrolase superfamily lysophospholipase
VTFIRTWVIRAIAAALLVAATLVIGGALDARRRHPDLKPWHQMVPNDLTASEMNDAFDFGRLLARESEAFATVDAVEAAVAAADRTPVNRFAAGSRAHYSQAAQNWNRTFELQPDAIAGGALLIHGLTDSPYSMKAVAETLRQQGYYALALRMPGHGTVPAGLTSVNWHDWLAAVRVGARRVRQQIGPDKPLVIVGYSNGGALAVKYALEALDRPQDPRPSSLVLISPMIGVTPAARLAWWISRLGFIPYFEKARWLDVIPEYNPFKYNSFPANAGFQTSSLTRALQADFVRLGGAGRLKDLPPMLTFQSIVDATVSTTAVLRTLYDQLPANGSALVLFDVNRRSGIEVFVRAEDLSHVARLFDREARPFRRVLITNSSASTNEVISRTVDAGQLSIVDSPLGLSWPADVYSLTHIALPFTPDDLLYGNEAEPSTTGLLRLGRLNPRGERSVLTVSTDTLMRLSSNPFFPYVADTLRAWVGAPQGR